MRHRPRASAPSSTTASRRLGASRPCIPAAGTPSRRVSAGRSRLGAQHLAADAHAHVSLRRWARLRDSSLRPRGVSLTRRRFVPPCSTFVLAMPMTRRLRMTSMTAVLAGAVRREADADREAAVADARAPGDEDRGQRAARGGGDRDRQRRRRGRRRGRRGGRRRRVASASVSASASASRGDRRIADAAARPCPSPCRDAAPARRHSRDDVGVVRIAWVTVGRRVASATAVGVEVPGEGREGWMSGCVVATENVTSSPGSGAASDTLSPRHRHASVAPRC